MAFKQKIKDEIKAYLFFIGVGLVILFIFIKPILSDVITSYNEDKNTITNKEIQEFNEWENEQEKSNWENKEYD